jgi:tetratricopeptide (TPR) repeat protein
MRTARLAQCLTLLQILIGLALILGGAPVHSQKLPDETAPSAASFEPPPAGTALSLADAKAAQARAAQLFRDQRFPEAADLLRLAYRGDPRPILLFNAGQAYRKAELAAPAREMYEAFLKVAPEHALAPETRGYVKDMEALLSTQSRARAVEKAAAEAAQQAALEIEKKRSETQRAQAELAKTQAQLQSLRKPLYRRAGFWVGIGIGVLVVVAAGAVGGFVAERTRTDGGTLEISR